MKKRFQNCKAGSTLVEVVVAITILGLVCVPICSSLVLAARVNARAEQVMAAELSVSSAVERLMADGVTEAKDPYKDPYMENEYLKVVTSKDNATDSYYKVIVTSKTVDTVQVTTYVRATPVEGGDGT